MNFKNLFSKKKKDTILVIDTNVPLINSKFYDNYPKGIHIVIPFVVVRELNAKKTSPNRDLAANARSFNRFISEVSEKLFDTKEDFVEINGMFFGIVDSTISHRDLSASEFRTLGEKTNDDYIVATAIKVKRKFKMETVMVSNDVDVRVRSNKVGIKAVRYAQEDVSREDVYSSCPTVVINDEQMAGFYVGDIKELDGYTLDENSGFILDYNGKKFPARVKNHTLVPLKFYIGQEISKLKALNNEQKIFLDMLLDPDAKLVSAIGVAGSGKSLLAIAVALHMQDDRRFKTIRLVKGTSSMGGELGFLPGTMEEKIAGFRLSYEDSFDFIGEKKGYKTSKGNGGNKKNFVKGSEPKNTMSYLDSLITHDFVTFSSPTFMRGISKGTGAIGDLIIIDESQNLTPMLLKSIITRFGENSKIIVLGDVRQIDNRYITARSNGLVVMADALLGDKNYAHITLHTSFRSDFINRIDDAF